MPTLVIARHAKAEAPSSAAADIDRTLALIGRQASMKLGEVVADAGLQPDVALVSPATRTQQTWKLMSTALPETVARTVDEIYETDVAGLLKAARMLVDVDTAIMVGHEPTSSAAGAYLAGPGSDKAALQRIAHGLPTATAAVLEFDGNWADLDARCARLTAVLSGRDV